MPPQHVFENQMDKKNEKIQQARRQVLLAEIKERVSHLSPEEIQRVVMEHRRDFYLKQCNDPFVRFEDLSDRLQKSHVVPSSVINDIRRNSPDEFHAKFALCYYLLGPQLFPLPSWKKRKAMG